MRRLSVGPGSDRLPLMACGGWDLVEANEEDCFGNRHPNVR